MLLPRVFLGHWTASPEVGTLDRATGSLAGDIRCNRARSGKSGLALGPQTPAGEGPVYRGGGCDFGFPLRH